MMSIHSAIRARREALGLSQKALAEAVSLREGLVKPLTWQTVQGWERDPGGTFPKRARLAHVAAVLGTTVESLLAGELPAPVAVPYPAAGEPKAEYSSEERLALWPFEEITYERFRRLTERQKGAVEEAMLAVVERIEANTRKRATGS